MFAQIYKAMSHGKERMLLHLRIGQHIMELDDERFVLDAADQLNRGSGLLVHESERLDLVQLNLKASAQALQRGGINLIADFLSKAIGLIKDNDWSMSYELILDVYNRAAGAELARGNIPSAQNRVQQVIAHGVTLEDKLPALLTSIECFAASRDYSTAIRKSRRLLAMLGERLPGADQLSFALEYRRTRNLIKLKTDNDLINLEPIVDERLEWIAKVFQVAATNGWRGGDQQFAELVFLRTMRFTLTHGSSDSTPFAYAGYGVIVSSYGDVAEGRRFADLALRQLTVRETVPAAAVLVHLYLAHLQRPAAESLEPLLASYRIGLEIGELTFGALALEAYASLYLFCGLPLGSYVNDMQAFCGQLRLFNQVEPLTNMLPMLQLALNMTGQSTNVLDCSWDACGSQHNFGQGLTLEPTSNAALLLDYVQMFNAYVFNALDVAREAAQRANHSQLRGTHIINIFYAFIDSLVHFALYRRDKKRADYKMAKRAMQQLEWADERSQNCSGMMLLLVAEKASFKSENGVPALKKIYNYAISQLLDDGYLHFAAIANERAGEFFVDEDPLFSCVCLSEAVGLYAEWEAAAKITALQRAHPSLQPRKSRQSVRGLLDIVIPDL
jgi:predicted ATPase